MPRSVTSSSDRPAAELAIFTICASNYLAHASVLGASIREHHPELRLVVFLLDKPPLGATIPDHLVIVPAERVMERREWNHRCAHYDILEFATSVKPACFRFLFDCDVKRVIYLDPDIQAFARVDSFWRDDNGDPALVLTPHILTPLPDDGRLPDDLMILRAGTWNLGFAAMRDTAQTRGLLDWWDAKLHNLCLRDPSEGVFTDQKWMEFAPLLVRDSTALTHAGFNAAYWNLHERVPRRLDGAWHVDGPAGRDPLVFFHFSGYAPDKPGISKHESRFRGLPPGDAPQLFGAYAQALAAAGLHDWAACDVPRVTFRDGTGWDVACRALYRQIIADRIDIGDPLDDTRFLDWAAGRDHGDHLARYLRTVLRLRPDVAAAYDDGRNHAGLLRWLREAGVPEIGLDRALVERFAAPPSAAAGSVNYLGYLRAHLGVGEAARQSVAALEAAGISVHAHDISGLADVPTGQYALPVAPRGSRPAAITILGCNADALPGVLSTVPRDLLDAYRIGYWYWETQDFPEHWSDRFDLVDEVWVASRFVADAIRAAATVPVVVMPPMVHPPRAQRDRAWLSRLLPDVAADDFVFLFQFDVASVAFRKNPEGVIEAFSRAFTPEEPARLIVKVLNSRVDPVLMTRLRVAAAGRRITLLDTALESDDRFRLLASVDSFVSLHRSEGFGLSIAEAMAYGLPVVATGWSGNADFTTAENAALVPYDLLPSDRAHGPYPAGTIWAEPRLDDAARLMRRVRDDTAWREAIGKAGQATIERLYSAPATGAAMRARLRRIAASARYMARRQAMPSASENAAAQGRQATVPVATDVVIAAPPSSVSRTARYGRLLRDVMRFPGYYVVRLPRLPALLWRSGVVSTLERVEVVVTGSPEIKGQYRLVLLPARVGQWWIDWRARRPGQGRP